MGLLLVCPDCHTKVPMQSQRCPQCGADLKNLPEGRRQYFFGSLDAVAAPPPEPVIPEAVTLPEEPTVSEAAPFEGEEPAVVHEEAKKPEKETKKKKRTTKKKT